MNESEAQNRARLMHLLTMVEDAAHAARVMMCHNLEASEDLAKPTLAIAGRLDTMKTTEAKQIAVKNTNRAFSGAMARLTKVCNQLFDEQPADDKTEEHGHGDNGVSAN